MRTAADIASQVRSGRLRAVEVVDRAVESAIAAHDALNAFTLIDPDGARHRAEAIDRLVAEGKDPGPLAGVPIGLKDIIDDAGMPTTSGSSFPSELAANSATVVRRIGAAGGIIIGRTGLHEFAFGFTSENPWFGPVRNPWDVQTSPGGSSGGSGAVVAAGVVPIAIGTDTGGSVRVPAALCRIMGLKVTHGRVPLTGVFPLVTSLDTVGPIARTIDDLALAYTAMAGDDPADPWSQPAPVDAITTAHAPGTRLGVVRSWLTGPRSPEVDAAMERFINRCRELGIDIVDIDDEAFVPPRSLVAAIGAEILEVHADRFAKHPDRFGADVAKRIADATDDGHAIIDAERWGSALRGVVARLADDGVTALVAPTVGASHKVIGVDTMTVGGTEYFHRDILARYTAPVNRARLPALSVPVLGGDTPAESVQLIGPMWSEATLLGLGRLLEAEDVIGVENPPIFFGETD